LIKNQWNLKFWGGYNGASSMKRTK
jgi:hypothetical protein